MVRAKFRIMEIKQMWNGECTEVRLLPVSAKSQYDPDGSEENKRFWEATPSGKACVVYRTLDPIPPCGKIGSCVYIDMQELDAEPPAEGKRAWQLHSVTHSHSLDIHLHLPWSHEGDITHADVEMDINNEGAWPPFTGKALTYWSVEFTPAPG